MSKIYDVGTVAKQVRAELKKEFPGHKFSVTIERYSMGQSLSVSLVESPESPFLSTTTRPDNWGETHEFNGCVNVNHYHLEKDLDGHWLGCQFDLTDKAAEMLKKVIEISNRQNWNNSDSMTDYYDVNYAFDLHIGKWDKPFKATGQQIEVVEVIEVVEPAKVQPVEVTEPVVKPRKTTPKPRQLGFKERLQMAFTVLKTGKI